MALCPAPMKPIQLHCLCATSQYFSLPAKLPFQNQPNSGRGSVQLLSF